MGWSVSPGVELVIGDAVAVAVPSVLDVAAPGIELYEADPVFQQTAGDEALAAEVGRQGPVQAIHFLGGLVFPVQVHRLGGRGLHAVGQLVGIDPACQLGFPGPQGQVLLVQGPQEIQRVALGLPADAGRG